VSASDVVIRPARVSDLDDMWSIFQAVVATGDTYVFAPDTPRSVADDYFLGPEIVSYVSEVDDRVVGMYKLIANRRDLGAHVANASFMVHPDAAGRGLGRALGQHCLEQARAGGYTAMQFNFVVSTNTRGLALWMRLGFVIIATIPAAFQHRQLGLVDAHVMYRSLDDIVPRFGAPRGNEAPIARPSAYALIYDTDGRVAVVHAREGTLLPGGGIDPGETPEEAAVRETAEECGLQVRFVRPRGAAVQFTHPRATSDCFEKRSTFIEAAVVSTVSGARAEHDWQWLSPAAARWALTYESHRWALST
jgi:8-oxo-dGTP pyrophosphatase MutT (NUDIX family)/GNAT superfamily N-acetyltransferase